MSIEEANSERSLDSMPLEGIAIIGMSGRFPGAADLDAFWKVLVEGKDTITRFAPGELKARNASALHGDADYVAAHGVLEDAAMFDAEYFGISPREADRMDPQHRVFLEACSNALEDAGYVSADYEGEIGLFAGCSLNTYLLANLATDRAFLDELTGSYQVGEFPVALGNDKDFLTTRAAYKLNLRGPVVSVQSACATSLVAICQASQALMNYQCDMALAGGVSVTFPQERGHVYQDGGIVSRDGHCRPFDADATGTVFGHGVGVVVLKRLEDAVRDGDHIAAVLLGYAVNNDGSAKAGYMAPGVDGQARAIAAAQAMAGVPAKSISYVEAHGTGTPLGDPIEIAALTKVFREGTDKSGYCAVGTAKGNVGHLDAAAGVTGVMKTVLSMQQRMLPGLMHFKSANANIELKGSPFRFSGTAQDWKSDGPLRAGVSAFGVGGVNAHVVLEEAPQVKTQKSQRTAQVLCVSGRSERATLDAAGRLAKHLEMHPEMLLEDVAFTLGCGRKAHEYRVAVGATDLEDARHQLMAVSTAEKAGAGRVAFLFSGQGTQFVGMGRELYEAEPVYRRVVDECAKELKGGLGCDLRDVIFADAADGLAAERLLQTGFAQPALYVTELALAELWKSWGVKPQAMVGHSLGEYVAATLAGVMEREDALRLVWLRGQLMQALPSGAMISVPMGEAALAGYVSEEISIAGLNSPRASVLAGPIGAIEALERRLDAEGTASRKLRTSHAFHSAMMEPILAEFELAVSKLALQAPKVPFVSTVTGKWITDAEATSAGYWARQCRMPVRFADALASLVADGQDALLEVGPGRTLATLAMQQVGAAGVKALPSFTPATTKQAAENVQSALGELWMSGVKIDWNAVYGSERRQRVSLPTYPFERKLHWVAPPAPAACPKAIEIETPVLFKEENLTMATATLSAPTAEIKASISTVSRTDRIQTEIARIFAELSGIETPPDEYEYQFLELGFDSLFLTQATQSLSKAFKVKLTFRQLMEQFSTITSLAAYLDTVLVPEAFAAPPKVAAVTTIAGPVAPNGIEGLVADQITAMQKMFAEQVATLRAAAGLTLATAPTGGLRAVPQAAPSLVAAEQAEVRFNALRPAQTKAQQDLDEQQKRYLSELIARYTAKTAGSKRLTAQGRSQLADPRAVAGFRPQWKEMVYPLITERARGSRLWDVDGNEYIDIVNGYGCIMFGHSPEFVVEAAREQLERGVAIGPQTPLAAEVAALMCELTGNERVTFCNTGSEAVMAAIRVARTVTGRDKLVYFTGDYHGTFDEVLIRNTPRGSAPVAPGIPLANVTNVVVLEYGADASFQYLRVHADEIAAVLVEPVQTRHPDVQPMDFIRTVRTITEQTGSAMILDEVVTGFRLAPGGVQEYLGIRADMCTYGKVIGGGHPIGVLSGKAEYLDALDGGAWQYGDDSGPEVGVTFFAGTFVRHPLAMAAARSVLRHLKDAGPELQRTLNEKTARLAESLDRFFVERGVPSRIHHFASWFYFTFQSDARLGSLLYYAMREKGIHIQEGYPCFLTTAHTDADIATIEQAFRECILEMQESNVLPGKPCLCQVEPTVAMHPDALKETPLRIPLTEPQREIYLAAALNEEANCAFNESLTLHLHGAIREADFLAALKMVVARHDALRSTVSMDGEWMEVSEKEKACVSAIDLRGLALSQQDQIFAAAVSDEAQTPFDLVCGPLVRACFYRFSDEHAALLLTAHHIVLDGWSVNQVLQEVGKVYSARPGQQPELAPLLPFSSYAMKQRQREEAGEFTANEVYWVDRFSGRSPRLELPTDRPRGLEKSYRGSTLDGRIGADLYQELKKASARAGCSLYVTLLSGFQILLHRLTGQSEVVVGISTAGQSLVEDASLVGHAVNFLPMLSELKEGMRVDEHLRATKTILLDAYDHQEFTFGSMLRKLKLEREPGRLPLIEVQFNLERVGANVVFDGLRTEIKGSAKKYVNTDLFLNVIETDNELQFTCDYNTDLFDATTLTRWMDSWTELLRSEVSRPSGLVSELSILGDVERAQLVSGWNGTGVDFGEFCSVVEVFLSRAVADAGRVALECGGVVWTYGRLRAYALGLAGSLVKEGLEPGGLVGICVERSPEMVGAVLAVMLAGGAYVPLDPRHPQERLEMVLEDAGAELLLTMRDLGLRTAAKMIDLSQDGGMDAAGFVPMRLTPESLAYVIYTSGSTGRPKGVAIEQGALMNLLRSMQRTPGLNRDDTLVAITTLAFDIAGLELLLPLLTGAKLVVATDAEVQDGRLLLGLLESSKATVLQATPGAWRILIDAGWSKDLPLKALCGGEALPRELAEKLLDRAGEVWNMYGPTETTIWSSATRVTRGTGMVRIGPPIANTQFYVLDEYRQLVPIGVTGELYIGGAGLARGYWKKPELTEEKFIRNPFGEGQIYATGDLARWKDDGTIELLGRTDFQVKIRGYRIELAEIEAAIMKHPAVKETVVTAPKAERGVSARLVAYVATTQGSSETFRASLAREIPKQLMETLPDYMIPTSILVLKDLPRTANGKVDRKALPQPSTPEQREVSERQFTAPSTSTERLMCEIWSEILELGPVGVTESIFELGADSLLIFRIAARAQREGLAVTATQIFQERTIARICAAVAQEEVRVTARPPMRIAPATRERYRLSQQKVDA